MRIGIVVVDESLSLRIPIQFSGDLHGDVAEQAGAAGAMADFGLGNGQLSGLDALQPVEMLLRASIELRFFGPDLGVQDAGMAGVQDFLVAAA